VYPPETEEPIMRTAARMRQDALQATRAQPVHGLYGPCVISFIPRFDPSKGVPNEYMHNTLSGITKTFITVWLTDHRGRWYIKSSVDRIDEFLSCIHPPDTVKRTPRSLMSWMNWKASEWLFWLLFYSLPALLEVRPMDNVFLRHWILLVKSIHNLLLEEIKPSHLEESKNLLNLFLQEIKPLYSYIDRREPDAPPKRMSGEWMYSFNVHQVSHLPMVVEETCPLLADSAFDFEDNNGVLGNLTHGTTNIDKELAGSLQLLESIRVLRRRVLQSRPESEPTVLADVEMRGNHAVSIDLEESEIEKIRSLVGNDELTAGDLCLYSRAVFNGKTFSSHAWTLPDKRNSCTVKSVNANSSEVCYGEMLYFVRIEGEEDDVFCVLECFEIDHRSMIVHKASRTVLRHILPLRKTPYCKKQVVCSLSNVKCKLVRVGDYVCIPPNQIEINL